MASRAWHFSIDFFFANSFRKCLNYCATFIFSAHLAQFANGSATPELRTTPSALKNLIDDLFERKARLENLSATCYSGYTTE